MMVEFFLSIIVLVIAIMPVFAWQPTRSLSLILICLYVAFLVMHWPFVTGASGVVHDTENGYLNPFILYKQWLDAGIKLGWNPYLGGGQPLELLNNFIFLPTYAPFLFLDSVLGLRLNATVMFNWAWTLLHLLMCTGATLAAFSILRFRWSCLFVTTPLLFGSFWGGLIAPAPPVVLCLSVYLLFFWYNAWRKQSFAWLILFVAASAFSLNFYIPHYVIITFVVSIVSFALFEAHKYEIFHAFRQINVRRFLNRSTIISLGVLLVVFFVFASPFIHMFVETLDFVSPTRGFTVQGEMISNNNTYQKGVGVHLSLWTLLTDRTVGYDKLNFAFVLNRAHWPIYIGAVATVLCAYGLVSLTIPWISVTTVILAVISFGPGSWLWEFLIAYVPFMNLLRHSFPFVGVVVFFLLILGASVIENQPLFKQKAINLALNYLSAILLLAILLVATESTNQSWHWLANPMVFGSVAAILMGFYILLNTIFRNIHYLKSSGSVVLLVILVFECGSVAMGRAGRDLPSTGEGTQLGQNTAPVAQEFIYPTQWESVNRQYRLPFDWDAMFSKKAVWLSLTNDSMFLLQKDFAQYARKRYSCEPTKNCSEEDLSKANLAETGLTGAHPRSANLRFESGNTFVLYPHDIKENLTLVNSDRSFDSALKVTKTASIPNELKTVCAVLLIVRNAEGSIAYPDELRFKQVGKNNNRTRQRYPSAVLRSSYSGENLLVNQYEFDNCLEREEVRTAWPLSIDNSLIERDVRVILLEDSDLNFILPLESHNPNLIRLLAHAHDHSLLLRKENYHPNWGLTINGTPHKIDRTSENFQIVSLDPGLNDLVFSYESIYDPLHEVTRKGLFFYYLFMIVVLGLDKTRAGTRKLCF